MRGIYIDMRSIDECPEIQPHVRRCSDNNGELIELSLDDVVIEMDISQAREIVRLIKNELRDAKP